MNEDRKSLAPALGGDTKGDDLSMELKPGDSMKAVERFPSFVLEPHQLLFTDTAVGELMSVTTIWFSRDFNVPKPSYRPSSLRLIPRLNEVSRLESLLVAWGWHGKKSFSSKRGIESGVVLVDYEEQMYTLLAIKARLVAQRCENAHRLATRYQDPTGRRMRPIWIIDMRVLR